MSHRDVGIVGYGVYIPWERIETEKIVRERERKRGKELERVLEKVRHGLLLREKALAGHTEDTITIATEAAENAVRMPGSRQRRLGASLPDLSRSPTRSEPLPGMLRHSSGWARTYSSPTLKEPAILECRVSDSSTPRFAAAE